MAPMALRDGEPVELAPMQGGGEYDFPDPIGLAETVYTLHSEVRTFGESFGCRQCSFRLSLKPAVVDRIRDLATATPDEIAQAGRSAPAPSPETVSAHVVEAETRDGHCVRVSAVTRPMRDWELGGGIVSTGSPAAAVVRLMARGRIDAVGALPPERCVDAADLFAELELRNCRFDVREVTKR
jgi:saccharopine dehydrogenase-like NADP-dependent oxidoreductase